MYSKICSYENLLLAFQKARMGKTKKRYVKRFEKRLKENLSNLREELISQIYKPCPLKTFIIRDPKSRKISKSAFKDRVVHHALCNVISPIFENGFVYDSYANRIGKGTLKAIERFDKFKRKVSKNNTKTCFVLKADIRHYFQEVDHSILFSILKRKIQDNKVIWLIEQILFNLPADKLAGQTPKGMPLGNLTSQFFANVYLNELDQFVKHKLKAKYYIRYVDDFVILHESKEQLFEWKDKINQFIKDKLSIELHPEKSDVHNLSEGINFLGFRIFFYHKLLKKSNLKNFERKFNQLKTLYKYNLVCKDKVFEIIEGWLAYASNADTYKYRMHLVRLLNQLFPEKKNESIINKAKYRKIAKKIQESNASFSVQKTLLLLDNRLSVEEIAKRRKIKISTVWWHLANLIEHKQLSVWKVLPRRKVINILGKIHNKDNGLREIKSKIKDKNITFDEINCVLNYVKRLEMRER